MTALDHVMVRGDQTLDAPVITHFRQVLVWPVHLQPLQVTKSPKQNLWELLAEAGAHNPWREVEDEFTGDPTQFHERHYSEFVAFLPPVQRFLYGDGLGRSQHQKVWESPIKVMRRTDIARVRVLLDATATPIDLKIAHIDLYFFADIDVAMLAFEVHADNLPLAVAQGLMFKLGRAYPAYWDNGHAGHCPASSSPT